MFNSKIIKLSVVALIITLVLVLTIFPLLNWWTSENFNGSGYGLNNKFGTVNTIVPLNNVSKSTDFKLFSLMSQVKFSFIKPPSLNKITRTSAGIISKSNNNMKNIILFPGQGDYILTQNNSQVWPINIQNIDNNESATVYANNKGHFNTVTTLLENLNYKEGDKLNTITYDFRNINFQEIIKQFKQFINGDTVIIAYDFGAVIANICINILQKMKDNINHSKISKLLLICPTIGGVPMTLRDYFSGNNVVNPSIIQNYHSVLLSMPNKQLYDDLPIAIYNSISYNAKDIHVLMDYENKPSKLFKELQYYQHLSIENSHINTIIITNDQYNTPVSYNFRNNLKQSPEKYNGVNNNQIPLTDIHNNGKVEGLQANGDGVVPISVINKLYEKWGANCKIELIKDKDHFTILKSYELALIIMANL